MTPPGDDSVVIGRLGRPHGVRGWLHVRSTGATLADLAVGETVVVRAAAGGERMMTVAALAGEGERMRIAFREVGDREGAGALTGALVAVDRERVPAPADPDTFFVTDLIGCAVSAGGRALGTVREVHAAPANDVLEVVAADGASLLLPFVADAIERLDPAAGVIRVRADLLS